MHPPTGTARWRGVPCASTLQLFRRERVAGEVARISISGDLLILLGNLALFVEDYVKQDEEAVRAAKDDSVMLLAAVRAQLAEGVST